MTVPMGPQTLDWRAYLDFLREYQGTDIFQAAQGREDEQRDYERGQANRQFSLQKRQLDQSYQQMRANAKNQREALDLDRWYKGQQVELQKAQLLASLRGPRNVFQALDMEMGFSGDRQQTPVYLQRLLNNQTSQTPTTTAPSGIPESARSLLNGTSGGSTAAGAGSQDPRQQVAASIIAGNPPSAQAGWSPQDVAALSAIGDLYRRGGHKLSQQWGQLTQDQQEATLSGVGYLGGSERGFLESIERGGIGQGSKTGY